MFINLTFYISPTRAVQWSIRSSDTGIGGDDVEESFYLDGPRSRMYIGVAGQHVDSGG